MIDNYNIEIKGLATETVIIIQYLVLEYRSIGSTINHRITGSGSQDLSNRCNGLSFSIRELNKLNKLNTEVIELI